MPPNPHEDGVKEEYGGGVAVYRDLIARQPGEGVWDYVGEGEVGEDDVCAEPQGHSRAVEVLPVGLNPVPEHLPYKEVDLTLYEDEAVKERHRYYGVNVLCLVEGGPEVGEPQEYGWDGIKQILSKLAYK